MKTTKGLCVGENMQKEVLEKAIKSVQAALEIKKRADALAAAVKAAALKAEQERLAKERAAKEAEEKLEQERLVEVRKVIDASFGELKYKVLKKTDTEEVRLYKPGKRTIRISGHDYFLPFPYMLFRRSIETRGSSWHEGTKHACLYAAFTTADVKNAYYPPFQGLNGFLVCLDDHNHYDWPVTANIEKMIGIFWQTQFHNSLEHYHGYYGRNREIPFDGRYHNWAKIKSDVALEAEIKKLTNVTLEQFMNNHVF